VTDPWCLADLLTAPADEDPDRPAIILADGEVCSFGRLAELTAAWAAALHGAGVGPGGRVALAEWGGPRGTAVTLAATAVGAATAQINPLLTVGEIGQLVDVAGCGPVAVAGPDARESMFAALGPDGNVLDDPVLDDPVVAPGTPSEPIRGAEALVLFTSGTTGLPKPVSISNASILTRVSAYRPPFSAERPPNRSLMCVPSFHVGGMLGLLLSLWSGDTTVIQPRFDAGRWLELVEEHQVASVFVVPTMLARILDHPTIDDRDLSSLRLISYGAAAAPIELVHRAMERWPDVGFANTFGQTETLGAYTTLGPDDHRDPARVGSVGRPVPGVDIRIVSLETGEDVPDGELGELWVRSDQNVADGWLHTGDLGRRDADGYLYPSGRISDGINRGGEKFGPGEIADVVRSHPDIAEVAVAGVPDPELGERVGVAVVMEPGVAPITRDGLRDYCRGRLAPFKLPEVVAVLDRLPVNELGKLPRRVVAEAIGDAVGAAPI
jgi:acyl-CoA synthetase (AMP-forming)/AMP-acid ligase II